MKSKFDEMVLPDSAGHFGAYGGRYVAETLMPALMELEDAYKRIRESMEFSNSLKTLLKDYVGRPTPLYFSRRLSEYAGGANIYLKREDLAHTGAHKINNTVGQVLLAHRMGKKKVIAETGAGQHGVATAAVSALLGMKCRIFMGAVDMSRQAQNVERMKLLGAEVIEVSSGNGTLNDAMNEAIRQWIAVVGDTFYVLGTVAGPHPYPMIVRDFQRIIGDEAREQIIAMRGSLPDILIACVGGGSNALGLFHAFMEDDVDMIGVEAGGNGIASGLHAASLTAGSPGVLHGAKSYLLQDEYGQVKETYSISAGLDYPGIGPEHSYHKDTGRIRYEVINDDEAVNAFGLMCSLEGILPALESSHAVAQALKEASMMSGCEAVIVNLSGRGDKDIRTVLDHMNKSK